MLTSIQLAAGPHSLPLSIPALLHFAIPAFRVLLLVPLFIGLIFPRVVYTPVNTRDDTDSTDSTFLLPAGGVPPPSTGLSSVPGLSGEASKYGTFQSAHPAIPPSGPVTRAHTPVPSHGRDKVCITRSYRFGPSLTLHTFQPDEKPDVALDPSWGELGRRLRRISPYLWPSKSISLQFLAVSSILSLSISISFQRVI
jgi:hypothetical protein